MKPLNNLIHQPVRLQIMASLTALPAGDKVEFTWLRKRLGLTDGNLGAHLLKLEEAGYLQVEKVFVGRKPRTYLLLTTLGRGEFEAHVAALKIILE